LAASLARTAVSSGNFADALEYLDLAIRNFADSGNFSLMNTSLAILAGVLDKQGSYEPAATISACADYPWTRTANPEIITTVAHLRETLGDQAYESLAHTGKQLTDAAMAGYALDQIEQSRARLGGSA
jgi:hypothetical protein